MSEDFDTMFNGQAEGEGFEVQVDFSETSDFQPLTAGAYKAVVGKLEKKTAQSSGEPTLVWTFNLLAPFETRKLWANTSLQSQALWKLKAWLEMLGLDLGEGAFTLKPADVVGKKCLLLVGQRPYQGKMKNEITDLLPYGTEGLDGPQDSLPEVDDPISFG